ncbi:MAG: hypothetical protein FWG03_09800 [Clostridiales bacterium]|nr:hypothetical protein [Clostridiales bacterium]
MARLVWGEIYRLLHKRSMYIYFALLAACYAFLAFVRSGGFDAESILRDANSFFEYLPVLAGGFLFAAVYTDDLNSKNLISLVGFGMGKTKIVIAKFLLMAVFCAIAFGLAPLFLFGVHAALGWTASADALTAVYIVSFKQFLVSVGFAALSGIVVYGLQRTTFAIVAYVLLAFGIISGLASWILNTDFISAVFPGLSSHLMGGITSRVYLAAASGEPFAAPIIEFAIYVAVAIALSSLAFHKKEMEF